VNFLAIDEESRHKYADKVDKAFTAKLYGMVHLTTGGGRAQNLIFAGLPSTAKGVRQLFSETNVSSLCNMGFAKAFFITGTPEQPELKWSFRVTKEGLLDTTEEELQHIAAR
jgi:hypothetical protein